MARRWRRWISRRPPAPCRRARCRRWPGEREILRIAAWIAEGIPVDLREAAFRLDAMGAGLAASAILHAACDCRGVAARGEGR